MDYFNSYNFIKNAGNVRFVLTSDLRGCMHFHERRWGSEQFVWLLCVYPAGNSIKNRSSKAHRPVIIFYFDCFLVCKFLVQNFKFFDRFLGVFVIVTKASHHLPQKNVCHLKPSRKWLTESDDGDDFRLGVTSLISNSSCQSIIY